MTAAAKRNRVPLYIATVLNSGAALLSLGCLLVFFYGNGLIFAIGFIFPLGLIFSTFIHEGGHAIGALLARWRVIVIAVWPFAVHISNRDFVVHGNIGREDGGGFVAGVPARLADNTRLRWAIFLASGPLACLAAGIGLITLGSVSRPEWFSSTYHADMSRGLHWPFLGLTYSWGILCLRSFVVPLIPGTYRSGDMSDGGRLLDLVSNPPPPIVVWIQTLLHYNVRLRDIPVWMYDAARAESARTDLDSSLHDSLDVSRTLDEARVDQARAREYIERYRLLHGDNDWLLACETYLAAVHENDMARAEAALDRMSIQNNVPALTLAVRAAIAARKGEHDAKEKHLDAMDAALKRLSPFRNPTFQDIRRQIEAIAA